MNGKLYFGIAAAATLILALMHRGDFFRFLLGFELLLGLALFLDARVMCRKITARLRLPEPICQKGSGMPVEIELVNCSPLPAAELRVEVSCKDRYTGKAQGLSGTAMLDGNDRVMLRFVLDSVYCGVLELCLERVTLWDHLGVFSGRCIVSGGIQELSVLPRQGENMEIPDSGGTGDIGEGETAANRSADDSGDTYDIREFHRGDMLKQVHWKMTAKTDELMVRDFGGRTEDVTVVLLDMRFGDEAPERKKWDHFLETVAGVSGGLLHLGYAHEVVWLDVESSQVCRVHVAEEEQMQRMLCALLRVSAYENGDISTYYKENFADETPARIIRIDLQGTVGRGREQRL